MTSSGLPTWQVQTSDERRAAKWAREAESRYANPFAELLASIEEHKRLLADVEERQRCASERERQGVDQPGSDGEDHQE